MIENLKQFRKMALLDVKYKEKNFSQIKKDIFDFAKVIVLSFFLEFDFAYLGPEKIKTLLAFRMEIFEKWELCDKKRGVSKQRFFFL